MELPEVLQYSPFKQLPTDPCTTVHELINFVAEMDRGHFVLYRKYPEEHDILICKTVALRLKLDLNPVQNTLRK